MRIRVKPSRRRFERITLNLASMIDVTFLLLIYFMVTTIIAQPEDRLSPTLQTTSDDGSGTAQDWQPQIIEAIVLGERPVYRLGNRVFEDRAALLQALGPLPKGPGLFVHVTDRVPVGFAVAAVQIARDAGFEQVTYVPSD